MNLNEPKNTLCRCPAMQPDGKCEVHRWSGPGNWPPLAGSIPMRPTEVRIEERMFWCPRGRHFVTTPWQQSFQGEKLSMACPDCQAVYEWP